MSILGQHFFSNCSTTNCQFLELGSFCLEVKTTFAHSKDILDIAAVTATKLRLAYVGRNLNKAKRLEKEKTEMTFDCMSQVSFPCNRIKFASSKTLLFNADVQDGISSSGKD